MSRKSSRSRRTKHAPGRFRKFLRALLVSAAVSFTATSCVLNPQLAEQIPLASLPVGPLLEQIGLSQPAPPVPAAQVGEYVQTRFAGCPHFFAGPPPLVPAGSPMRELCYDAFAILHNGSTRTPVFVAQRLNRRMLAQAQSVSRTDRFFADARLPSAERAELDDYRNSGYSRGHMAPAGDMHNAQAMEQSFTLANMVPQNQRHNSGAWNRIENDTRKYIMRARGDVHVFTGPVYLGQPVSRAGRVAVPTHLYKLVYDTNTGRSWVYWQANSADAEAGPPISYEAFLQRTGLRLLPAER